MVALFVSLLILSPSLPILWNLHLEDREEKAEGEKTKFFSVGDSNVEWKVENICILGTWLA